MAIRRKVHIVLTVRETIISATIVRSTEGGFTKLGVTPCGGGIAPKMEPFVPPDTVQFNEIKDMDGF